MKLITAYIQPEKLEEVKQALFDAEVGKMSVTNSLGCGQQGGVYRDLPRRAGGGQSAEKSTARDRGQ